MTSDDYVRAKLLSFAYRSGMHVSKNAVVAIMLVVRNRVDQDEARDWLGVIRKLEDETNIWRQDVKDVRDPQFISLLEYVDGIYDGTKSDRWTCGATYFYDGGAYWFDLAAKERVGSVEGLILFK